MRWVSVRDAMGWLDAAIARRRRVVLALWLVVVAVAIPFALRQGDELTGGGFDVPGSDSTRVERLLQEQVKPDQRQVVLAAVLILDRGNPPNAFKTAIADLRRAVRATKGVGLSSNIGQGAVKVAIRKTARHPGLPVIVPLIVGVDEYNAPDVATDLRRRLGIADGYNRDGVRMHLVGQGALWAGMLDLTKDDLAAAEHVGFPIVLVILLLVFGSLSAALLPLSMGAVAVTITGAVIYWLSTVTIMNVYVTNMASMLGIGVAVDYSLFVLVRYREELRAGRSPDEARLTALTTSGVAVVFSGLTVVVALASLFVIDTAALRSLAGGAIVVVAVAVLLTATLLPALLGVLGTRISPGTDPTRGGGWERWASRVMRRPWLSLIASALLLLALAVPAIGLTLGDGALRQLPQGNETRTGFDAAIAVTSPGRGAPLKLLVPPAEVTRALAYLRGDPEVERVARRTTTRDGRYVVVAATPRHDGDSEQAKALVKRLRRDLDARVLVGGNSAAQLDFDDEVLGSLWQVVLLILVLTFVALAALLRSVVLPLKAIVTNLLSVAAAFGVLTIVYVWGWFDGLFGFESSGYIDTFTVPVIIAMVFGLSMDYEVFLLSRIRERYEASGDTRRAVGEALTSSARTITGAAVIMVAVFGVFIGTGVPAIQQVGLGCAVAIAIDATVVRLVLVPAAMVVLGRWNWWWPGSARAKALTATGLLMALTLVGCGGGGGTSDDSVARTNEHKGTKPSAVAVAGIAVKVDPSKAGTSDQPQGVGVDVRLRVRSPRGMDPPTALTARLDLPEGTAIDGGRYPSCERAALKRGGVEACPAASVMGHGSMLAEADTAPARGVVTVVNGGEDRVWLYTTLQNPVRIEDVIDGKIDDGGDNGGTRLEFSFPESLQTVGGVPIGLRELHLQAGHGQWLTTTSCPDDGRWPYSGEASFADGTTASYADDVPCS
jgi:RND superfamily putative drug exporter